MMADPGAALNRIAMHGDVVLARRLYAERGHERAADLLERDARHGAAGRGEAAPGRAWSGSLRRSTSPSE